MASCNLSYKTRPQCSNRFKDRVLDRLPHGSIYVYMCLMNVWLRIKGKQRLRLITREWMNGAGKCAFFTCCIFICTLTEMKKGRICCEMSAEHWLGGVTRSCSCRLPGNPVLMTEWYQSPRLILGSPKCKTLPPKDIQRWEDWPNNCIFSPKPHCTIFLFCSILPLHQRGEHEL